jgi:hypothetical protein
MVISGGKRIKKEIWTKMGKIKGKEEKHDRRM